MKTFKQVFAKINIKYFAVIAAVVIIGGVIGTIAANDKSVFARDCEPNSIIWCGVGSQNELSSKYASLDSKGRAAFANAGVNPSKFGQTVLGSVTRDNRVVVNGRTVATNVYTYGRSYMPGSTQISGGAYMRHPSVSFRSSSIPAYVYMEGGSFKWAVITSCGNPVKGNPTQPPAPLPKPGHTINKKVSHDLKLSTDGAYFFGAESIKATPGQTVRFVTMATNTGNTNLDSYVLDSLPPGTSFVKGTFQLKQNGKIIQTGNVRQAFDGSYGWFGILKPNQEVKIDIFAKYNTNKKVRNIACINNPTLGKKCDDAYVTSEPAASCVSLTAQKVNLNTFKFTGKSRTKDGATVKSYYFKPSLNPDIPSQKVHTGRSEASIQYTYSKPGTYTAQLTLVTSLGAKSGEQCKVKVTVLEPTVVCEYLQVESIDRLTRRLSVTTKATNGATISGYAFDFGDGEKETTEAPVVTHTYEPGSYTAKVTLKTSLGDKTSEECELRIQIADEDEPALDIEKRVTKDLSLQANEEGYEASEELVQVAPNKVVKFIIKFTNIGNVVLEDVQMLDVLPEGLSLEQGDLETVIEKIEPGESVYFEVTATANESIGNDTVTNVVCVKHDSNEDGEIEISCSEDNCPKNPDIKEGEDLADCDDAKVKIIVQGTPEVLPRTGIGNVISGIGSLGFMVAGAHTWITSRRRLALAHLSQQ